MLRHQRITESETRSRTIESAGTTMLEATIGMAEKHAMLFLFHHGSTRYLLVTFTAHYIECKDVERLWY